MTINIGKGTTNVGTKLDWSGLEKVTANLALEVEKVKTVTVASLLEAGLLIKSDSMRITPVDTGNLRQSAYVLWGGGGERVRTSSEPSFKAGKKGADASRLASNHAEVLNERKKFSTDPFVEIGYTAHYAAAVHEGLNSSHAKSGTVTLFGKRKRAKVQVGQAKFLEQAFVQNAKRVITILKRKGFGI